MCLHVFFNSTLQLPVGITEKCIENYEYLNICKIYLNTNINNLNIKNEVYYKSAIHKNIHKKLISYQNSNSNIQFFRLHCYYYYYKMLILLINSSYETTHMEV